MSETDKPFACTSEGCQMTFTNEDHLNVHQKKHDMVLNLGLSCKNNVFADQTPTPTRFIRNCEEVGLFQDLQNVNPFEETFKKAIEQSNSGSVHVPESSADDTLHTPHIFPHITEGTISKFRQIECQSQELIVGNLIVNDLWASKESELHNRESSSDDSISVSDVNDMIIPANTNSNKLTDACKKIDIKTHLKEKLKVALQNKQVNYTAENDITGASKLEKRSDMDCETNSILTARRPRKRTNLKCKVRNSNEGKHRENGLSFYDKNLSEAEKRRAMNRMAQMRSRERKKLWLDQVENDMNKLKDENKYLCAQNSRLKDENMMLKTLLLNCNNCSLSMEEVHTLISIQKSKGTKNEKRLTPIKPKPHVTDKSMNTREFTSVSSSEDAYSPLASNKRKVSTDDTVAAKSLLKSDVASLPNKNKQIVPQTVLSSASLCTIVNANFVKEPSRSVVKCNLPHMLLKLKSNSEGMNKICELDE